MPKLKNALLAVIVQALVLISVAVADQSSGLDIEKYVSAVTEKTIAWRRDIHEHPELGNREFRTAELIAAHLKSLGMEVTTGVAHTGVVGLLRGTKSSPVLALRADMDALPVTEVSELPFASKVKSIYNGREVGVMHACGHDNHVAILMGAAEVLAQIKDQIPGTIKFIFQPAEEGAPEGEEGGANLMIKEGVLENPKVDAIFGLHVGPAPLGTIGYKTLGIMASSDSFKISVEGSQTHGALPWYGIDPIVAASQIVLGIQTITSRQLDVTLTPSVISVGSIHGGVRNNIIPAKVEMTGTIRTFDEATRDTIHSRLTSTAQNIAASSGAKAVVSIKRGVPVTSNDPELTEQMVSSFVKSVGSENVYQVKPMTPAEDFSFYQKKVPGMFFNLGVRNPDDSKPAPNHSPYFYADERALPIGVKVVVNLALDYLNAK